MKIKQMDLWHVSIPAPAPFYPSWIPGFPQTENRFTLIRIRTESGLEGWSAGPAMGKERKGLGELLGPYLLGERADDIVSINQRIREMGYLGWRNSWIEAACWDIIGKAQEKPVYELLGGSGGKVTLYASTGEVKSGKDRVKEVEKCLERGFKAIKLRVHADTLEEDLEQIRTTRKEVGEKPILGVDANQAWRVAVIADAPLWDYQRALAFCKEAEELDYYWVEEPLAMDAYESMAKLRANTKINISGGELNNQGYPEFMIMLEKKCYDWYQPDAVFTGGISGSWKIIKKVEEAGFKYSPHTWTNGIGFAMNMQLFAASSFRETGYLEYPYNPPSWIPRIRDGILKEIWQDQNGELVLPETPGLGFEIDHRALRKFGKHYFKANKLRIALGAIRDKGIKTAKEIGEVRDQRLQNRYKEFEKRLATEDAVTQALS